MTAVKPVKGGSTLAREALSAIRVYEGASGLCRIDLSDNTSQWGTPPSLAKLLFGQTSEDITRYPAPYGRDLKVAIALYLGVDVASIVTGCGSDDVLDSTIRAFGEKGESLAHLDPSFGMIPVFTRVARLEPVGVSINAEPEEFAATGAKIIYLCSPNNPTGRVLSRAFVEQVVRSASGLVIVDEAYAEFAESSVVDLVSRYENLIVTRTFSKAFGLAGLRIGYGVATPAIAREVEKVRGPYKAERRGRACRGRGSCERRRLDAGDRSESSGKPAEIHGPIATTRSQRARKRSELCSRSDNECAGSCGTNERERNRSARLCWAP